MNKRQVYDKVRKGIESKIYKTIRLIKKNEKGDIDVLFGFNKMIDHKEALEKFEYIKFQIDNNLPAGTYEIQCKNSHTKGALVDCFPVEVKEKKELRIEHKSNLPAVDNSQTVDPEVMENIDFDDYVNLIKENAELRAQNKVLELDRDFYKKLYETRPQALADGSLPVEKSAMERGFEALENIAPGLLNLGDKLLDMHSRKLMLQERQLLNDSTNGKKKIVRNTRMTDHFESELNRLSNLYEANPDEFEDEMDLIEQQDPDLYEYICTEMGIEENEIDDNTDETESE